MQLENKLEICKIRLRSFPRRQSKNIDMENVKGKIRDMEAWKVETECQYPDILCVPDRKKKMDKKIHLKK